MAFLSCRDGGVCQLIQSVSAELCCVSACPNFLSKILK